VAPRLPLRIKSDLLRVKQLASSGASKAPATDSGVTGVMPSQSFSEAKIVHVIAENAGNSWRMRPVWVLRPPWSFWLERLHSEIVLQFSAEPFGFFLLQTAGRCDRSPIGQLQFKVVPNLVARLKIRSELKVLNRGSRDHARSRETQTRGADVEFTVQNLDGGRA